MIGQRIKELRGQNNISQKELSSQLFVTSQAISKWERDEATPNPEAIAKMAEIFSVSADYLVGLTDDKERLSPKDEPDIAQAKIALFGGDGEVTDEMWEEAVFAAELIKNRHKRKKG